MGNCSQTQYSCLPEYNGMAELDDRFQHGSVSWVVLAGSSIFCLIQWEFSQIQPVYRHNKIEVLVMCYVCWNNVLHVLCSIFLVVVQGSVKSEDGAN